MSKNNQSNKYVPKKQGGYIPPSNTNKKKSKFTLSQWIVFILMIFWTVCSCLSIYLSVKDITTVSASTEDNKKVASTYADNISEAVFVTVPIQLPVYFHYKMSSVHYEGSVPWVDAYQECRVNLYPTLYTFNIKCTSTGVEETTSYVTFYDSATNWTSQLRRYGQSETIFTGFFDVYFNPRTVFVGADSNGKMLPFDISSYAQWEHLRLYNENYWFNRMEDTYDGARIYINVDYNFLQYNALPDNVTISLERISEDMVRLYYTYRNSTIDTDSSTYFFQIYTEFINRLDTDYSYTRFIDTTSLENGQYMLGFDQGYNLGLAEGDNAGYQNGYDRGYTDGKNVGYNQGVLESNDYSFLGLLGAVVDAPISVVSQWLNFDLLGFNMSNFFFAICTLALTIAIIRLIL